jgi:hypothetical protein
MSGCANTPLLPLAQQRQQVRFRIRSSCWTRLRRQSEGLALGAKTIELIHQNVHVNPVRDDLETLVVDAELLEAIMGSPDPTKHSDI